MKMKLVIVAFFIASVWSMGSLAVDTQTELSAREIMEKNEMARKADTSETADLEIALINGAGKKRTRRVSFNLDDTDPLLRKSYLKYLSPKNVKGTAFLQLEHEEIDNDRWLYFPALRKTRRISGSDKTDSFLGTDFSFEDFEILDGKVSGKNKNYQILGSEEKNGEMCWIIEAVPATEEERLVSGYGKRLLWISKEHYYAIYTEFFDHDGYKFKSMESSNFSLVPGGTRGDYRPHRLVMKTFDSGHTTIIDFKNFVLNLEVNPKMYTRNFLSRG